MYVKYFYMFL